jgi:hypothetical protein
LGNKVFCVAGLTPQGELRAKAEYRYEQLERVPGAAELIGQLSGVLWRSPEAFEVALQVGPPDSAGTGTGGLHFRWRSSAPTAGIATLRCGGELTSLSLLATGISPEADTITLQALQRHLLHELRDTGYEPAFALTDLTERPVLATIDFRPPPGEAEQRTAALADRCFAAAYFRYHGLA